MDQHCSQSFFNRPWGRSIKGWVLLDAAKFSSFGSKFSSGDLESSRVLKRLGKVVKREQEAKELKETIPRVKLQWKMTSHYQPQEILHWQKQIMSNI